MQTIRDRTILIAPLSSVKKIPAKNVHAFLLKAGTKRLSVAKFAIPIPLNCNIEAGGEFLSFFTIDLLIHKF
jgi:hypothetical protein